jgi:hypothetical protein
MHLWTFLLISLFLSLSRVCLSELSTGLSKMVIDIRKLLVNLHSTINPAAAKEEKNLELATVRIAPRLLKLAIPEDYRYFQMHELLGDYLAIINAN